MPRCTKEQRNTAGNFSGEAWKDIPDYVGLYQVSDKGRIKRLPTTIMEITEAGEVVHTRKVTGHILKQTARKQDGYYCIGLYKDGKINVVKAHQLVASAFCPKLPEEIEVHHIDRDRHNNNAVNLIWLTPEDHAAMHRIKTHVWRDNVS